MTAQDALLRSKTKPLELEKLQTVCMYIESNILRTSGWGQTFCLVDRQLLNFPCLENKLKEQFESDGFKFIINNTGTYLISWEEN